MCMRRKLGGSGVNAIVEVRVPRFPFRPWDLSSEVSLPLWDVDPGRRGHSSGGIGRCRLYASPWGTYSAVIKYKEGKI
jgi:hypothetical protein